MHPPFLLSQGTAARRRFYVHLVDATDGITPETGESGGQPQISKNGAAFANTSATLTSVGNGLYYVELTAGELDTLGIIAVRYKSANTAEFQAIAQVGASDSYDSVRLGLTALPNAAAEAAGGLYTRGSGAGQINQNANGQVDSRSVALAADVVTATSLAADAGAEIADAVWDEAMSGHVASGSFGQRLQAIRTGTAQAGAAGSITLDASASASDDFYKNALVLITAGTGANQVRTISGYTGSSKVATVTPNWVTTPSSDSVFVIIPMGAIAGASAPTAAEVADAVWDEARSGHTTGGSFGEGAASVQGNVTGSVGSVTGAVGSVTGAVGSVGSGGITSTSIATGAIDADSLAADAVAEIADGVWDEARSGHVAAGSFGEGVASVQGNVTGSTASIGAGGITAATVADATIDAATIATDAKSRVLKNTALANFSFLMVLASDHITPGTGLTVTATRSIDGAAFGACANAVSEISNGIYKISLAAADLNGDVITLRFTAATADDRFITIVTQQA